jgi:AAA domain
MAGEKPMLHVPSIAPLVPAQTPCEPVPKRKPKPDKRSAIDAHVFDEWSPWDREPAALQPRHWLYGRHYLAGALSMTVAPPGLGKSSLAISEAVAMALGRNILGAEVSRPLNVLYWNGEEPTAEIIRRVYAACQHFGIDPRDLKCRLRIASGLNNPFVIGTGSGSLFDLDDHKVQRVCDRTAEFAIDVWIIDPFVATHRCPENDNSAMDAIARAWAGIASTTKASVELVHHTRKHNGDSNASDSRGASALLGVARSVRVLNAMTATDAASAGIKHAAGIFRTDLGKTNYAAAGASGWYQIVGVDLPNGDAVGVAAPWQAAAIEAAHRDAVLAKLGAGDYRSDMRADTWAGRAVAEVMGLDPEADKTRLKAILRGWLSDGTLREVEGVDAIRHKRIFIKPDGCVSSKNELTQTDATDAKPGP